MKKTDVNLIDPDLITDLQDLTSRYAEAQQSADKIKWQIAQKVNDSYSEHKGIFAGDKLAYYVECSRVANDGLAIKIFGESGQTLRRWCEVQAAYENFPQAELLLEETSFKHLAIAKRAAKQEKAASPIAAMDWALAMGASADDMQEHYFPASAPTEYDKWTGAMSTLLDLKNYEWISSAEVKESIIGHVNAIETIKADYLKKKGLAE
jgi:hypothetical protein